MPENEHGAIEACIGRIRNLASPGQSAQDYYQAACLAQSVLHDTLGGSHPVMVALTNAITAGDWGRAVGATRSVLALNEEGALTSPRLKIAREIESSILDVAQAQAQSAEANRDAGQRQVHLAIAAFLAGASLEDALRRLCDAQGLAYDAQRASISKLQAALYQPSKQIEVISQSENKQITAWGDTRNKADHGKFDDITHTEVVAMIMGIRSFIEKHLP